MRTNYIFSLNAYHITLNIDQINYFILEKHHLTNNTKIDDIVKITDDIWGLHATGPKTPYLSLFARTNRFNKPDLDRELGKNKTLYKLRCVRKTVHIINKENIPIAYQATKKFVEPASNNFMKYIGVTEEEYKLTSRLILHLLSNRGLSAREIKDKLKISSNISSIVNLMCDQALLVRGLPKEGWKSNNHIYYIFNEYSPDINLNEIKEYEAKKLLVKHYISSYGPVTETDISWWSAFTRGETGKILKDIIGQIKEIKISNSDKNYIVLNSDLKNLKGLESVSLTNIKKDTINLLPSLDPYIMGYKERDRYIDNSNYNYVFDRSGNAASSILLNGKITGVWDYEKAKEPTVKFFLFEKLKNSIRDEIYHKAEQVGKFISDRQISDKKIHVKECKSMVPLDKRTAGGFMSPLKYSKIQLKK